jgi:hypothetical protein
VCKFVKRESADMQGEKVAELRLKRLSRAARSVSREGEEAKRSIRPSFMAPPDSSNDDRAMASGPRVTEPAQYFWKPRCSKRGNMLSSSASRGRALLAFTRRTVRLVTLGRDPNSACMSGAWRTRLDTSISATYAARYPWPTMERRRVLSLESCAGLFKSTRRRKSAFRIGISHVLETVARLSIQALSCLLGA